MSRYSLLNSSFMPITGCSMGRVSLYPTRAAVTFLVLGSISCWLRLEKPRSISGAFKLLLGESEPRLRAPGSGLLRPMLRNRKAQSTQNSFFEIKINDTTTPTIAKISSAAASHGTEGRCSATSLAQWAWFSSGERPLLWLITMQAYHDITQEVLGPINDRRCPSMK